MRDHSRLALEGEHSLSDLVTKARGLRTGLHYRAAHALMSRVAAEHDGELEASHLLAEAHLLLGQLEDDLGNLAAAEAAYGKACAIAASVTPARPGLRVRALTRLAATLRDRAAVEEADAAVTEAVTYAEGQLNGGVEHAEVLAEQSHQHRERGAHEDAERLATRAVALARQAPPSRERDEARPRTLQALGTVLRLRGRYTEAYPVLEEALTAAEAAFGSGSLEVADAHNDLGICGKFSGRFDEGVEHYFKSLAIFEVTVGTETPSAASLFHNLGGILHAHRKYDEAEPWARRSVELRERLLGPDHVAVAADRAALASILTALGRYDEADALLRRALGVLERSFGPDNHDVVANYGNLAGIARHRGDLHEAERLYRQALAAKERLLGPEHPELAITLNNLAVVCRQLGNIDEAESLYNRAIGVLSRSVEATHPTLVATQDNLNRLIRHRQQDPPVAEPPTEESADRH